MQRRASHGKNHINVMDAEYDKTSKQQQEYTEGD